ncbi:transposase [Budvicia aquatica]|nr:transposase [Budvicia aquatica]
MARTTRKNYSKEFKMEAAKLVCEQGFSCAEVARQLNVADQNISRWIVAYEQSLQTEYLGERPRSELEAELRRLRAENEELKQQKEILKKATVDSTCQRNTLFNYLFRCFELQCLSRPIV